MHKDPQMAYRTYEEAMYSLKMVLKEEVKEV